MRKHVFTKKFLGTAMAVLLAASTLSGCANEEKGEDNKTASSASTGGSSVSEAEDTGEPYKFSMYGNLAPELKESDTAFFDELMKQTNTEIELIIPPSSNYEEALTVMMASGDYPDLVLFPDTNKAVYQDAVKNGAVIPVDEYLENAKNITDYSYEVSFRNLDVMGDGKIYGIPRTSIARADGYLVRKDWLDKLGIEFEEGVPITRDEFTEILVAFTTQDPDGNGVDDTYGLGLNTADGNLDVSPPIQWSFGLSGWQAKDGEDFTYLDPTLSKNDPTYKEALTYFNELWAAKYIDPDWPTLTQDAMLNRFEQGILGVIPEFAGWLPDKEANLKKNHPEAELAYIVGVVENEGDKVQGGTFSTGLWGCWGIMSTAEDPQKIVDVLDYLLSDDFWETTMYGVEGVAWEYDADQNKIAIPNSEYAAGRAIMRRNNSSEFFVGVATPVEDRERINGLINICIEQAVFSMDEGYRPDIMDDPAYLDSEKDRKTAISKIIAGDQPVDSYDDALVEWYGGGGEIYVTQMNEHIENINP